MNKVSERLASRIASLGLSTNDVGDLLLMTSEVAQLEEALGKCFYVLSMKDRDTAKWLTRRREAMEMAQEALEAGGDNATK